ncbi:unnamed protein product [Peniophora sp. CBMAI 1063]|nr:unnamed protein product [Peniophora sp. CBMAI 1063]
MGEPFDVIPFEDIAGDWTKLGSGSFGNVYKGQYLGIDVAIKEILPSNDYDVGKYFEREWRLLKESRHPNVVLYLGLSRAPDPDGRVFIISEFIEAGNVRQYIWDKSKPFPWRLRVSFATDIARALAYLHARRCIHRDLKGENLLVTSNGRLKITDFGFARIAARSAEESRRLTFCGTDAYMSPEILRGDEFDLPTDVYSMGVILAEIAARKLADDRTFKRAAPGWNIDEQEIRELASPGCPDGFVQLAIDCLADNPSARPTTRQILERLRAVEVEILSRPRDGEDIHTGSIKFLTGAKRPGAGPRIPSFGMGVAKDIRGGPDSDSEEEELRQAVLGLQSVSIGSGDSQEPLIRDESLSTASGFSDYSTTVIRSRDAPPALSSILTVRASPNPASPPASIDANGTSSSIYSNAENGHTGEPSAAANTASMVTIDSFYTAGAQSGMSIAAATEGGSELTARDGQAKAEEVVQTVHRFTLVKAGAKRTSSPSASEGWGPLEFFRSGLLGSTAKAKAQQAAECDVCGKRLGKKAVLECDDCGMKSHLKCGDAAPLDCGYRALANGHTHHAPTPPTAAPSSPPAGKKGGRK